MYAKKISCAFFVKTEKAFFCAVIFLDKQEKTNQALKLLQDKYTELKRLPKKSDFDSKTVCFIKQKLGAWPRALEIAGLKIPKEITAKEKTKIKREKRKLKLKQQKRLENHS